MILSLRIREPDQPERADGIDKAEAEERERLVANAEENRNQALQQVIENGKQREPERVYPLAVYIGLSKCSHPFLVRRIILQ